MVGLFDVKVGIFEKWFQNFRSGPRTRRGRNLTRRHTQVFRGVEFRPQQSNWTLDEVLKPFLIPGDIIWLIKEFNCLAGVKAIRMDGVTT